MGLVETMENRSGKNVIMNESQVKPERMANLELLRCVAMMMVVALHYLGKGNLLADLAGESLGGGETAAWLLKRAASR